MEDNKLTEFEEKIVAIYKECLFAEHFPETFLRRLRQIMPPTCTKNERKFLDWIREKLRYEYEEHKDGSVTNMICNGSSMLQQEHFPDVNLAELVEKKDE